MDAGAVIDGADPTDVEVAIDRGDPFTGDAGFAGRLSDGRLARDVLGRFPLFVDGESWAFSPEELQSPTSVPAGSVVSDGDTHRVWELPEPDGYADDVASIDRLDWAVRDRCGAIDCPDAALGFSGGLDSTLLAAAIDAPLYTVGFPGEPDVERSKTVADDIERDLTSITLTHESLEAAIPSVATAIDRTNAMDVAIGLSLYLLAQAVSAAGHDHIVLGQGADELFGGYEKIAYLDHRVAADSVDGARREVLADLPAGLERDVLAVRAAGVEPVFPYLGDGVVLAALRLDGGQLVHNGTRKWALRQVGKRHLPPAVAMRDKRAIQYGNGVAKELDRLARRAGFKRRMDRHVDRYVTSLLE